MFVSLDMNCFSLFIEHLQSSTSKPHQKEDVQESFESSELHAQGAEAIKEPGELYIKLLPPWQGDYVFVGVGLSAALP